MWQDYRLLVKFSLFCEKLSRLLTAGFDLKTALAVIHDDETEPDYQAKIQRAIQFINCLQILLPPAVPIELGGTTVLPNLTLLLDDLANYTSEKLKNIQTLLQRLLYPCFLLLATLGILLLFALVILPAYRTFFVEMSIPTPLVLKAFYRLIAFVTTYFLPIGLLLLLLLVGGAPKIGAYLKSKLYALLFPSSLADRLWLLGVLVKSGLNFKQALVALAPTAQANEQWHQFQENMLTSGDLATEMTQTMRLSRYQNELLKIGAQTGSLASALIDIARDWKERDQKKMLFFLTMFQPALLIVLGLLVFGIIYLTFLPVLASLKNIL